jgi:hypothetical protein
MSRQLKLRLLPFPHDPQRFRASVILTEFCRTDFKLSNMHTCHLREGSVGQDCTDGKNSGASGRKDLPIRSE